MAFKELWQRASHLGVEEATPPRLARYVVLLNTVMLLASPISIVYLAMNLRTELPALIKIGMPLGILAAYLVALSLNRLKQYWLAIVWLFSSLNVYILFAVLLFGPESGSHYYLIISVTAIALFCPPQYRWTATILMVMSLGSFFGILFFGDRIVPFVIHDSLPVDAYHWVALASVALLTATFTHHSRRRGAAMENSLEAAYAELERSQSELVESEKHASIGRLAAGLLHEVNTPLGTLRASADTIAKSFDRMREGQVERAVQAGTEASRSLTQAAARVGDALETLKRFVALDEAERKPFDIRQGIDDTLSLMHPRIEGRIRVVRQYPEKLALVICYPAKLNRVFLSLLENAVEALDSDDVESEIQIQVAETGEGVVVEIVDNGKGIPSSAFATIFDFGLTRKGDRIGMRLGLPMSKSSVEEIGGSLQISSVEGQGTTATIFLPTA